MITAFGDFETHHRAAALGAKVVDKPFDVDELIDTLEDLVEGS